MPMNFIPSYPSTPEHESKKEILDDNARKFITEAIEPTFLEEHDAISFKMVVDWLETGEDNEKKIVYKKFDDGTVQILLISKVTEDGNRTSEKEKIPEEKYNELLVASKLHLEKRRTEFEFIQNDVPFSLKYDEFGDEKLRILEIDASDNENRDSFDFNNFPTKLFEITGDIRFYGYRMTGIVESL